MKANLIIDKATLLHQYAQQLAGVEPITRLLSNCGDEGEMQAGLMAIGGLCDSLVSHLFETASELKNLAEEGGAE